MLEEAPPLDVAQELEASDRSELKQLVDIVDPMYELLGRAWETAPLDCPLDEARCVPAWERTFRLLAEIDEAIRAPGCDRQWSYRTARRAREESHRQFIARHAADLKSDLRSAAQARGASAAYEALTVGFAPAWEADCPSAPHGLETRVPFGVGDASLSPFAVQALERMREALETIPPIARLEVRGHVDPREKGDARALSSQRSQTVASWLEKNAAISAGVLTVVPLGAALPIDTSATPEGRARNRRVDFQPK